MIKVGMLGLDGLEGIKGLFEGAVPGSRLPQELEEAFGEALKDIFGGVSGIHDCEHCDSFKDCNAPEKVAYLEELEKRSVVLGKLTAEQLKAKENLHAKASALSELMANIDVLKVKARRLEKALSAERNLMWGSIYETFGIDEENNPYERLSIDEADGTVRAFKEE